MIKKYVKKPIIIEAIQWNRTNEEEVLKFGKGKIKLVKDKYSPNGRDIVYFKELVIETLEGNMTAKIGDYIIKGVRGELYPCKKEIFEETYKEVEDD